MVETPLILAEKSSICGHDFNHWALNAIQPLEYRNHYFQMLTFNFSRVHWYSRNSGWLREAIFKLFYRRRNCKSKIFKMSETHIFLFKSSNGIKPFICFQIILLYKSVFPFFSSILLCNNTWYLFLYYIYFWSNL